MPGGRTDLARCLGLCGYSVYGRRGGSIADLEMVSKAVPPFEGSVRGHDREMVTSNEGYERWVEVEVVYIVLEIDIVSVFQAKKNGCDAFANLRLDSRRTSRMCRLDSCS